MSQRRRTNIREGGDVAWPSFWVNRPDCSGAGLGLGQAVVKPCGFDLQRSALLVTHPPEEFFPETGK